MLKFFFYFIDPWYFNFRKYLPQKFREIDLFYSQFFWLWIFKIFCPSVCLLYLNFKSKIFFHIFDNHNQIWQFNSKSLPRISRTSNVRCTNIGSNNFQHKTLNVWIGDTFNMSISHFFIPNLQWFTSNTVQNWQESGLKCVLEHAVKIKFG